MSEFFEDLIKHPVIIIIGILGSICSILGFFFYRSKRKNKLNGVEVGGDYVGGDRGRSGGSDTKNLLKNTKIKGRFTGGDDDSI